LINSILAEQNLTLSSGRYEKKFRYPMGKSSIVISLLNSIGFLTEYPNRLVRSTYFDSSDFKFARENLDGVSERVKVRLRWYESDAQSLTNKILEYKLKQGLVGFKVNQPIDLNSYSIQSIKQKVYEEINIYTHPILNIGYKRNYFTHPSGIRATVDQKIWSSSYDSQFGNQKFIVNYEVLEFKYPVELDEYFRQRIFQKISHLSSIRLNKSSKYVEGLFKLRDEGMLSTNIFSSSEKI